MEKIMADKYNEMVRWQLLRCIYDPMGMNIVEVENPQRFQRFLDNNGYGEIGYFIGTLIEHNDGVIARVELEGNKEQLELVLDLIKQYVGDLI
jgi:hypothetical protein